MKDKILVAVLVAAGVLVLSMGGARALSTALSTTKNSTVTCPAAGGAAARVPAASAAISASALFIYNESATCVRIGGAGVTSTTGLPVGVGCDGGATFSIDAREAYCISSDGSTVAVQVLYGTQ